MNKRKIIIIFSPYIVWTKVRINQIVIKAASNFKASLIKTESKLLNQMEKISMWLQINILSILSLMLNRIKILRTTKINKITLSYKKPKKEKILS